MLYNVKEALHMEHDNCRGFRKHLELQHSENPKEQQSHTLSELNELQRNIRILKYIGNGLNFIATFS